jgi:flavin-dependent dehydrogenase
MSESLGGCTLHSFDLAADGRRVQLPLPGGLAVSRCVLDAGLVSEAVRAGADFLPGTRAAVGRVADDRRMVRIQQRGRDAVLSPRVVVLATGLAADDAQESQLTCHERPGSRLGVGVVIDEASDAYSPGTIFMAVGRDGYVGMTRVEHQRLNIAAALDRSALAAAGPGELCARILNEAGCSAPAAMFAADWRGTIGLSRWRRAVSAERLFVVGDSAGYVEPFTGEGIAWALASGCDVVPFVRRALDSWTTDLAAHWNLHWRKSVARRQWLCRCLSGLLRHPALVGGLLRSLAVAPLLSRPIIGRLDGKAPGVPPGRKAFQ